MHVNVRFLPTDLVVPPGAPASHDLGLCRLPDVVLHRVSHPSGSATGVILHDCEHPSALRFLLPSPDDQLQNVREKDEANEMLASDAQRIGRRDGAGMATGAVCREGPSRVSLLRDGTER